jgi:hypothetical protein
MVASGPGSICAIYSPPRRPRHSRHSRRRWQRFPTGGLIHVLRFDARDVCYTICARVRFPAASVGSLSVVIGNENVHLRVLIANEQRERLELLARVVSELGHEVIAREIDIGAVAAVTARERPRRHSWHSRQQVVTHAMVASLISSGFSTWRKCPASCTICTREPGARLRAASRTSSMPMQPSLSPCR